MKLLRAELFSKISQAVFRFCEHGVCFLADFLEDDVYVEKQVSAAKAVAIVLSPDTMDSRLQIKAMMALMTAQTQIDPPNVIPVNVPGFPFPAGTFFTEVLPQVLGFEDVGDAALLIQSFFKRISVFFPTHASDQALETQAVAVLARITAKSGDSKKISNIVKAAASPVVANDDETRSL